LHATSVASAFVWYCVPPADIHFYGRSFLSKAQPAHEELGLVGQHRPNKSFDAKQKQDLDVDADLEDDDEIQSMHSLANLMFAVLNFNRVSSFSYMSMKR
jgi:hypothetical protein